MPPFSIPYYFPVFTATIQHSLLHSTIHCYHSAFPNTQPAVFLPEVQGAQEWHSPCYHGRGSYIVQTGLDDGSRQNTTISLPHLASRGCNIPHHFVLLLDSRPMIPSKGWPRLRNFVLANEGVPDVSIGQQTSPFFSGNLDFEMLWGMI